MRLIRSCFFVPFTRVRSMMILTVTSSTQAYERIQHALLERQRFSLTQRSFVRSHNPEDAISLIRHEGDCFKIVFLALRTYEESVAFEASLRVTHTKLPLVVFHHQSRISVLERKHAKDLEFPIRSDRLAQAMKDLLPEDLWAQIQPELALAELRRVLQST